MVNLNSNPLSVKEHQFLVQVLAQDINNQNISTESFINIINFIDSQTQIAWKTINRYGVNPFDVNQCSQVILMAVLIGVAVNIPADHYNLFMASGFNHQYLDNKGPLGLLERLKQNLYSRGQARKLAHDTLDSDFSNLCKTHKHKSILFQYGCSKYKAYHGNIKQAYRDKAMALYDAIEKANKNDPKCNKAFAKDLKVFNEYKIADYFNSQTQTTDIYRKKCVKVIYEHLALQSDEFKNARHYKDCYILDYLIKAKLSFSKRAQLMDQAKTYEQLIATSHQLKGYSNASMQSGIIHPIPTSTGMVLHQVHTIVQNDGQDIKVFTPLQAPESTPTIIVSARGTKDVMSLKVDFDGQGANNGFVQKNKVQLLSSLANIIKNFKRAAMMKPADKVNVLLTGHSMGGSTSELLATSILEALVFTNNVENIPHQVLLPYLDVSKPEKGHHILAQCNRRMRKNVQRFNNQDFTAFNNINELIVVSRCSPRMSDKNARLAAGMRAMLKANKHASKLNVIIDTNYGDPIAECGQSNFGRYMSKAAATVLFLRNMSTLFMQNIIVAHARDKIVGLSEAQKKDIHIQVYSNQGEFASTVLDTILSYGRRVMKGLMSLHHAFNIYTNRSGQAHIHADNNNVVVTKRL